MNHLSNVPPARDAGLPVPAAWLRDWMQRNAVLLRQAAVARGGCLEAAALADALEDYAAGEVESAHEALDCAAAVRRMGRV